MCGQWTVKFMLKLPLTGILPESFDLDRCPLKCTNNRTEGREGGKYALLRRISPWAMSLLRRLAAVFLDVGWKF